LLKYIEEFGKYVLITGFRNVKIEDTKDFLEKMSREKPPNVDIQFFDAKFVATWQHLYFAVLNALTAFKNKRNISKSIVMEIMLYASTQRQIRKAMEIGIRPDTQNIAMLIVGEKPETVKLALSRVSTHVNGQNDDTILELSDKKMKIVQKTFGISDLELETIMKKDGLEKALTDLVIERMALLTTQR
jgi:tRNA threonylcarbamoyladenosine modification (KEOPS) complex Cgi121 subunit